LVAIIESRARFMQSSFFRRQTAAHFAADVRRRMPCYNYFVRYWRVHLCCGQVQFHRDAPVARRDFVPS
jgi:hypothetical protein